MFGTLLLGAHELLGVLVPGNVPGNTTEPLEINMTRIIKVSLPTILFITLLPWTAAPETELLDNSFKISVDTPENGSIKLEPDIPADGEVAAGTIIRVTANPDPGYMFSIGVGP